VSITREAAAGATGPADVKVKPQLGARQREREQYA
jgi:hypothetical protein